MSSNDLTNFQVNMTFSWLNWYINKFSPPDCLWIHMNFHFSWVWIRFLKEFWETLKGLLTVLGLVVRLKAPPILQFLAHPPWTHSFWLEYLGLYLFYLYFQIRSLKNQYSAEKKKTKTYLNHFVFNLVFQTCSYITK